jgi:Terminase large subunit, T4likevirus-type, N-terminal
MNRFPTLSVLFDPAYVLRARRLPPDPWQREVLLSPNRQILLNCSRQSGKSTTVAALALHTALSRPAGRPGLVLLLSPSLRQSLELFRKVTECYAAIGRPLGIRALNQTRLEFATGSRIICLPGQEETIRSFSGVDLLIIDEAARVPDDLYRSVRPMLAVSQGRLICLSTPFGKRGFFYEEWEHGGDSWQRFRIPWKDCPRISPQFIELEKRSLGESWVRQEYECSFEALEGLVYPDFETLCAYDPRPERDEQETTEKTEKETREKHFSSVPSVPSCSISSGRHVGGIDFGFRNPFCALWGVLDPDDVLWIAHERYLRETPIHEHAAALPKHVLWYADPAGATEIQELRRAGLKVLRGNNAIAPGIAAVASRLRTGRLRVSRSACPNLLAEAKLYRYPEERDEGGRMRDEPTEISSSSFLPHPSSLSSSEVPLDQHNHALAALRYLVSRLDAGFVARYLHKDEGGRMRDENQSSEPHPSSFIPHPLKKLRLTDEQLWTQLTKG